MNQIKLFMIIIVFIVLNTNVAQVKGPKAEIPEKIHDFGELIEGAVVDHFYKIKNVGSEDLVIDRVRASCGCTAAKPDKDVIAPGDETEVKVTFNTHHRRGKQKKYVYVFTNDAETPDTRLTFTAFIKPKEESTSSSFVPSLKVEKNYHNFGEVEEGSQLTLNLGISNSGTSDLHIKNVKSSCGCTSTYLSNSTLQPGSKGDLKIDFDTSNRFGKMTRTVTIYSDDPSNPSKTITLFVNILRRDT